VTLVVTDESRLGPVPGEQLSTYRATSGRVIDVEQLGGIEPILLVDAIIGYSLNGAPSGAALEMIEFANSSNREVLALDVPSGVDSTTGRTPGAHIIATETMTLALPKTGLGVHPAGSLWLADIGIPVEAYHRAGIEVPSDLFGDEWVISIRPD